MAPTFEIDEISNTGPTDNSGLDTLWVAWLSEPDAAPEKFRFVVSDRFGIPSPGEIEAMIRHRAAGFRNDRNVLEQFRELERAHPPGHEWRRAVFVEPLDDDVLLA